MRKQFNIFISESSYLNSKILSSPLTALAQVGNFMDNVIKKGDIRLFIKKKKKEKIENKEKQN